MDTKAYSIGVEKTTRQVLDLLTRKREFALLTADGKLSRTKEKKLQSSGFALLEIRDEASSAEPNHVQRRYLAVGGPVASRDDTAPVEACRDAGRSAGVRGLAIEGCNVELLPIGRLYEICEGKALEYAVVADAEEEANEAWLREMLRLGEDPGKWYASDDSTSVKVSLRCVSAGAEPKAAGECGARGASAPADIAEFDVYDCLRGKFESMARDPDSGYGDDVFVEYSISSDEGVARYCAIEFYTNHNWCLDPANLFVVRFCAEIIPDECGQGDVQFSHPTKATERKLDHERFLVDSMAMTNDVETKFITGRGEDKHPDEVVSADRIMDNLIDFNMWVDMHRKEIELM